MFGFLRVDNEVKELREKVASLESALREKTAEVDNLKSRLNIAKLESDTYRCRMESANSTLRKQNKYASYVYSKLKAWKAVAEHIDPELKTEPLKYKKIFLKTLNESEKEAEKEDD